MSEQTIYLLSIAGGAALAYYAWKHLGLTNQLAKIAVAVLGFFIGMQLAKTLLVSWVLPMMPAPGGPGGVNDASCPGCGGPTTPAGAGPQATEINQLAAPREDAGLALA